ncbi:MAG: prolyl oligopeptidase family serine peptidase [Clostridia bacterium]
MQAKVFEARMDQSVKLEYLCDEDTDRARKPLLIYLHGMGGSGGPLETLYASPLPRRIREEGFVVPCRWVAPQCQDTWMDEWNALTAFLQAMRTRTDVDAERVYLMGASMGGYSTWMMGLLHPQWFAALVPMCGGGLSFKADRLRDVSVWAFHGAHDPVVPLQESERMIEGIRRAGGTPRLTIYPDAAHDCWTQALAEPELFPWLLGQRRTVKE